ncbi:hypothetical protein ACKWTF_015422 [Chironomus riparius]
MIKLVEILTCLIIILHTSSSWTTIECNYKDSNNYHVLKNIYSCTVNNDPNILTRDSAQINSINGEHMSSKSFNDVISFDVRSKTIQVFPRGLQTYFKYLKVIYMEKCGLKEIHQAELKPFPDLIYFFLNSNSIEVIEEGLFDNNPNLEAIGFWESKIVHIDAKVFDILTKLRFFWLSGTPCVKKDVWNSKENVQGALTWVRNQCTSADFLAMKNQLYSLEAELKTLNFAEAEAKITNFEATFNNSIFSKFRPLRNKMASLKIPKTVNFVNKEVPSVDLTSKLSLESEKCPDFDSFFKNLSKTMSNELNQVKVSIDELKCRRSEDHLTAIYEKIGNVDEKMSKIDEKVENFNGKITNFEGKLKIFQENFGNLQEHLTDFEVRNAEKHDKMEKEFTNTRHKIALNFDEKLKGSEKRLISKFEELLEEKLGKLLDEKLGNLINARLCAE